MRRVLNIAILCLGATLLLSSVATAQTAQNKPKDPWRYYPTDVPEGPGGPAPKRDLSGTWNGPGSSDNIPNGTRAEKPELTPLGQKLAAEHKPIGKFGPAGTNDPNARYCDPLGFPVNVLYQNRAMSIATLPDRVVMLHQFGDMWREMWTDGRPLPKNVGTDARDALDPTFNGYSAGHWEDDYNLVIDTIGLDDRTWLTRDGLPHTPGTIIHQRYTRVDKNTLKISMTAEDPKLFVKPFSLGTQIYKWVPNQFVNEWLCLPSEQIKYLQEQGDPAGSYPDAGETRYGGGGGR